MSEPTHIRTTTQTDLAVARSGADSQSAQVGAGFHRDALSPQAARDELLSWAARIGAVTIDALAYLQGTSATTAGGRLTAATRAKLLSRRHLLVGAPALYTLTSTGMRASGVEGLGPSHVSVANAPHTVACVHAAVALQRRYPDHRVAGERELRRDERRAGAPLASALLDRAAGHRTRLHRPDLVLWPPSALDTLPIAVEVELAVKAPGRLASICRAWARSRDVAGVLYIASPGARRALARAIEQACAHERIVVVPLEDVLRLID
jgi:hypothetical protein